MGEERVLSFTGSLKVCVALHPVDLRKSFNGLHGMVTERLGEDPRTGALFVFANKRRTRIKILYWDGTCFSVMTKRLEEGTFPGRGIDLSKQSEFCGRADPFLQ
jgi:transposase